MHKIFRRIIVKATIWTGPRSTVPLRAELGTNLRFYQIKLWTNNSNNKGREVIRCRENPKITSKDHRRSQNGCFKDLKWSKIPLKKKIKDAAAAAFLCSWWFCRWFITTPTWNWLILRTMKLF